MRVFTYLFSNQKSQQEMIMEIGTIQSVDIDQQMRSAYLDYAMSVIVARALPDARDGLKPVHRRILVCHGSIWACAPTLPTKNPPVSSVKCSVNIIPMVTCRCMMPWRVWHRIFPCAIHWWMDRATLVPLMVTLRQPCVTPKPACKLAEEMLADIDKNTVDFIDNFDGSLKEPAVLPSRLPNLLLNGSSGIAVGMATNIPPHNSG